MIAKQVLVRTASGKQLLKDDFKKSEEYKAYASGKRDIDSMSKMAYQAKEVDLIY